MRVRLSLLSEVARSRHDPAAEVVAPDAVHHHARGERIPGVRDPAGEMEAAAVLDGGGEFLAAQDLGEPAPGELSGVVGLAPDVDARIRDLLRVDDAIGGGVGGRLLPEGVALLLRLLDRPVQLLELLLQRGDPFGVLLFLGVLERVPNGLLPGLDPFDAFIQGLLSVPDGLHGPVPLLRGAKRNEFLRNLAELDPGPGIAGAFEEPVERVVVLVRDRVELVVVAAGAVDGQRQERPTQIVDGVLNRQMPRVVVHARSMPAGIGNVPGRDDVPAFLLRGF